MREAFGSSCEKEGEQKRRGGYGERLKRCAGSASEIEAAAADMAAAASALVYIERELARLVKAKARARRGAGRPTLCA